MGEGERKETDPPLEKEEARAKGQVTSEEKSDQIFSSVPQPNTETNNNWITKLAKEAHSGEHSKNVVHKTNILPGMEGSGDIIGGIMSAMWPSMTKMIEGEILKEVEGAINISVKYVPAVNLFRFTKSCMGTKFPRMRNFKLLDTSNNSVIMEMDIEYDGDCTLEMEVGTSLANIPLGIKDIKLSGTMRIELRDMVPCSPLISAIVAYFVDPPKMDFDLTGTANVADHPWIASTVRKLVVDGICTQLVDPHRIAVPLAAKCASKYRWPQPKNVWKITVIEAENLVNADAGMMSFLSGKSDPYVKIYMNCENQDITPVINDNLNPKWNHSTIMRTYRDDVSIQFNVLDSDMSVGGVTVDPDDELGCCSINLGEIDGDNLETWLDLKNIEHGRLKIRAERFHPEPDLEGQQCTKSDDGIQMMQVWIRSVENIDTESAGYKSKTDKYTVTFELNDGTKFDFGAGAYEPVLEETTAKWDQAKHHFGNVSEMSGTLRVLLNGTEIESHQIELSNPVTEITSSQGAQVHGRVTVSNFNKQ